MPFDATDFTLADFLIGESASVLEPPSDFLEWQQQGAWARRLYEPHFTGPATPRTSILGDGGRTPVLNFASYNYLGLTRHPAVVAAAHAAIERYGTGVCGPPMLAGQTDLHHELTQDISEFLRRDRTLLFTSGYGGGVGAVAGVVRRGDAVVVDEKCHMSVVDGARLAQARLREFRHNDPDSLDQVLSETGARRTLVVVEGLYSMDGDVADLPALLDVAERHRASVLIDEAHSMLTYGPTGAGVSEQQGVQARIGLLFSSLSKAFGGVGGFVSGALSTMTYLRHYSNPYLFSAGLPAPVAAALVAALKAAREDATLRARLWQNAEYMRTGLQGIGLDTGASQSYIIPVIVGGDRRLLFEACRDLRERGLFVPPVDYPVVAADQLRFRVAVTALHTRQDLDEALTRFEDVLVPRLRAAGRLHARTI
jgi:glycine C-acetyltransferase